MGQMVLKYNLLIFPLLENTFTNFSPTTSRQAINAIYSVDWYNKTYHQTFFKPNISCVVYILYYSFVGYVDPSNRLILKPLWLETRCFLLTRKSSVQKRITTKRKSMKFRWEFSQQFVSRRVELRSVGVTPPLSTHQTSSSHRDPKFGGLHHKTRPMSALQASGPQNISVSSFFVYAV